MPVTTSLRAGAERRGGEEVGGALFQDPKEAERGRTEQIVIALCRAIGREENSLRGCFFRPGMEGPSLDRGVLRDSVGGPDAEEEGADDLVVVLLADLGRLGHLHNGGQGAGRLGQGWVVVAVGDGIDHNGGQGRAPATE